MSAIEHRLEMLRKLAEGEYPYDGGPFSASRIEFYDIDAREWVAEIDRLRGEVARLRPVVEAAVETIEELNEVGTPDLRPLRRAVRALEEDQ